jgi:hypothetical protein
MAKFKYISLKSVIARVIELVGDERINEKTLYKWSSDAMKLVYVADTLNDMVCFSEVINYKAKLPDSWVNIVQVLYSDSSVDKDEPLTVYLSTMNLVPNTSAETGYAFNTTISESTEEQPISTTDIYSSNVPLFSQPQGTYIKNHHMEFITRPLQKTNGKWLPLRQSTSRFHKSIACGLDITAECCKHTFSHDPTCNSILVSFEKGWVCMSYQGYPKCDDGFLIPDIDSGVPQAIEAYLMQKVFEKEMIKGVEGASSLFREYQKQFELLTAKAKGNQKMFDADQYENFRTTLVRLGQHNNTYESGFGNSADFESLILR